MPAGYGYGRGKGRNSDKAVRDRQIRDTNDMVDIFVKKPRKEREAAKPPPKKERKKLANPTKANPFRKMASRWYAKENEGFDKAWRGRRMSSNIEDRRRESITDYFGPKRRPKEGVEQRPRRRPK